MKPIPLAACAILFTVCGVQAQELKKGLKDDAATCLIEAEWPLIEEISNLDNVSKIDIFINVQYKILSFVLWCNCPKWIYWSSYRYIYIHVEWRTPHELFPEKVFPTNLKLAKKCFPAWRFEQFKVHLFDNILIFLIILPIFVWIDKRIAKKLFICNILFCSKMARKGNSLAGLEKNEHISLQKKKEMCIINHEFVGVCNCSVV